MPCRTFIRRLVDQMIWAIIEDGIIDTITTIQIKKLDGAVIMLWDFNLSTLVVAMTVTLTRFFLI